MISPVLRSRPTKRPGTPGTGAARLRRPSLEWSASHLGGVCDELHNRVLRVVVAERVDEVHVAADLSESTLSSAGVT